MIMQAHLLVLAAEKAGMKVPPDTNDYKREEYPHFWLFEVLQLGRLMPTQWSHYTNAKIIAALPATQVLSTPAKELQLKGFR